MIMVDKDKNYINGSNYKSLLFIALVREENK